MLLWRLGISEMFIKSSTRLFDLFSLLVSICMVELLTATCVDALPNLTPNTEIDEGIERIAYSDRRNKLTLMETTDSFQLRLRAQGGVRFKVFTVDRPKRLVIDVYGARLRRNRRLPVTSSSELKRVRLGVHSNRLRAVLDLNIDWFPQVSGSLVGRTLELVVSRKQVGSAIPYELAHQLEFNRGVNVLAKAVAVDSVGMLPAPVIMGVRVVKEPSTLPVLEGSAPVLDVASVDQIEKTKFAALELDERMASLLPSRLAPSPIEPTDLSESVAPKAVQERVISSEPEVLVPLVQQIRSVSYTHLTLPTMDSV